jgi:hypothetical protein
LIISGFEARPWFGHENQLLVSVNIHSKAIQSTPTKKPHLIRTGLFDFIPDWWQMQKKGNRDPFNLRPGLTLSFLNQTR